MTIENTGYESLTEAQRSARQLAASERQVEIMERNTQETIAGREAQNRDNRFTVQDRYLDSGINLAKAWVVTAGGGLAQLGAGVAGKRYQQTLSGSFRAIGLLTSTAITLYEAHKNFTLAGRQIEKLGPDPEESSPPPGAAGPSGRG